MERDGERREGREGKGRREGGGGHWKPTNQQAARAASTQIPW